MAESLAGCATTEAVVIARINVRVFFIFIRDAEQRSCLNRQTEAFLTEDEDRKIREQCTPGQSQSDVSTRASSM
jgi:hypothetical protein